MASIAAICYALYQIYQVYKGCKLIKSAKEWIELKVKIAELERSYESLPDKRCKPGPAIRKALNNIKKASDKKDSGMLASALSSMAGDADFSGFVSFIF